LELRAFLWGFILKENTRKILSEVNRLLRDGTSPPLYDLVRPSGRVPVARAVFALSLVFDKRKGREQIRKELQWASDSKRMEL
jgi:hypothetical protein